MEWIHPMVRVIETTGDLNIPLHSVDGMDRPMEWLDNTVVNTGYI